MNKIRKGLAFLKKHGIVPTVEKVLLKRRQAGIYLQWIEQVEKQLDEEPLRELPLHPVISVAVPVYNVNIDYLKACIDSVTAQSYPYWELCIADDHSTQADIRPVLEEYMAADERIRVVFREQNGHISEATNSAIAMATGEFIGLLDNDDVLMPNALYRVAQVINSHPDAEFIYSDEDKLDPEGRRVDPFFKPDWAPDTFLSQNYICHFTVIKKALIEKVGGLEKGLEGAQDFDLFLKCTEQTEHIYHIPQILYHWRIIPGSTAADPKAKNYANEAGAKALKNAFARRGIPAEVGMSEVSGIYLTRYAVKGAPKVSVIITPKGNADEVKRCSDAAASAAGELPVEIIVSGGDKDQAAAEAAGDVLLFLDSDIEMLGKDTLPLMLGYAQQAHIGAVGAKLIDSRHRVRQAGLTLGVRGIVGRVFRNMTQDDTWSYNRLNIAANCAVVSDACMMIEKQKFEAVGGFNAAGLKDAYRDVDLCLRLLQAGYYTVCLGTAAAVQHGADRDVQPAVPGDEAYMTAQWGDRIKRDPFYNPNLTREREDGTIRIDVCPDELAL